MQIPKGKLAAAGLGVVTAVSSPTNYDLRFNMGTSTGPQAFQAREQGSAGEPFVITEALVDAKLEAVEARTETKFAQLMGKLDVLVEKVGAIATDVGELKGAVERVETKTVNTRIIIVTTVIGAALTIVGLTYGIIGYGHQVADTITAAFSAAQGAKK